jgi:hypothetical protein
MYRIPRKKLGTVSRTPGEAGCRGTTLGPRVCVAARPPAPAPPHPTRRTHHARARAGARTSGRRLGRRVLENQYFLLLAQTRIKYKNILGPKRPKEA